MPLFHNKVTVYTFDLIVNKVRQKLSGWDNKIFLMKLGYRLLANTESLWVQVLRKKYNIQGALPTSISRSNCSFIWKSLERVWPEVMGNVFWSIGDGRMTNFWNDVWVRQMGPLRDILGGSNQPDNSLRVCDLVTKNAIIPPSDAVGQDCLAWKWMEKDGFSLFTTYKNIFSQRVSAPKRVCVFLWPLWHDRLLTNNERRHRHMTEDGLFPLCIGSLETGIHAFGDCTFGKTVQRIVVPRRAHNIFFSLSIKKCWTLPIMGWIKLNSNGALLNLERRASIGGVLRDSNANWLWGYVMSFNNKSIFKKVEVECDNALLVELLLCGGGASILRQKWEIHIRHIPRTLNGVADYMTKCADTGSSLIYLFRFPLASVMNLLGRDHNMSISF
ncbi:hypothetical protein V6Z12_A03G138500 [Gossypium hirsutum]